MPNSFLLWTGYTALSAMQIGMELAKRQPAT